MKSRFQICRGKGCKSVEKSPKIEFNGLAIYFLGVRFHQGWRGKVEVSLSPYTIQTKLQSKNAMSHLSLSINDGKYGFLWIYVE